MILSIFIGLLCPQTHKIHVKFEHNWNNLIHYLTAQKVKSKKTLGLLVSAANTTAAFHKTFSKDSDYSVFHQVETFEIVSFFVMGFSLLKLLFSKSG